MKEFPLISILIANYNNGHFFIDCYKSLINQTEKNWEAIIIDDCSTDNSIKIIKEIILNDNRFKFYKNETNLGYTKSIIKAIEFSNSQIFGRLDPDDALTEEAIEKSLEAHNKNSSVGLVYSNLFFCDEKLQPFKIHKGKQLNSISDESYFNLNGEISHFATFKKNIYLKTSGIDPFLKLAQDKDIYMKMCEVSPVLYIDEDIFLYRIHNKGRSTNNNSEKAFFWHWVAIVKASERTGKDIEEMFLEHFIRKKIFDDQVFKNNNLINLLNKSRWIKIGKKLGLLKLFKRI